MSLDNSDSDINILLLGETGVGKSTFINSFGNYVRHKTFDDATKVPAEVLIPTMINVYDEAQGKDITLKVGDEDKNENREVGASATQMVKTYYFPVENDNKVIRMIDTPGLGDTRGCQKDDENFLYVVSYLAQLDRLHAICLLLKPSNDRDTALFSYVVQRILSQLHKSAVDNIVFIFTNTKGTDYRPGPTLPIFEKIRDNIASQPPYVKIPISNDNVFCLENESFKNLLALQNGVKIRRTTLASCDASWEHSCEEIQRFIDYIQDLTPHSTKQTVSINRTRDLIYQLAKPMAELVELVQMNISLLTTKEEESQKAGQSIEELQKKLFKPGVDIKIIALENPVVVCTECAETVKTGKEIKKNYNRRCHDPCLTGYVAYEIIGHWSLMGCSEMTWDFDCKHCNCSYKKHMTIYYDTEIVPKDYVDESVQSKLESEEQQKEKVERKIREIKNEKRELETELDFIRQCAARFAIYLESHSISSAYDSFKEYLHLSLEKQRSLGSQADMNIITSLNRLLKEHEQLLKTLREQGSKVNRNDITEESVEKDIAELFKLKYSGPKIKEIFEKRAACLKNASGFSAKNMMGAFKNINISSWFWGKKHRR